MPTGHLYIFGEVSVQILYSFFYNTANSHWLSTLHTVMWASMLLSPYTSPSPPLLPKSSIHFLIGLPVCVLLRYKSFYIHSTPKSTTRYLMCPLILWSSSLFTHIYFYTYPIRYATFITNALLKATIFPSCFLIGQPMYNEAPAIAKYPPDTPRQQTPK